MLTYPNDCRADWYTVSHLYRTNMRDFGGTGSLDRLRGIFKHYGYRETAVRRLSGLVLSAYAREKPSGHPYWEAIKKAGMLRRKAMKVGPDSIMPAAVYRQRARYQIQKAKSIRSTELRVRAVKYPRIAPE